MSIPSLGAPLPAMNPASAAANAAQAAQNAQSAVNNAAATMGAQAQGALSAQGTPLAPTSSAAANLAGGLQSAQNTTNAATGKPVPTATPGGSMQATQLLPNTAASNARLDTAMLSSGNAAQQRATPQPGANANTSANTGTMARMLQAFSQSTVSPQSLSTASGRAQVIPPGQGASLYGAAHAGGSTVANSAASSPNAPNLTQGAGNANLADAAAGKSGTVAAGNADQANAAANTAKAQTAAGAATLRAEGSQTQAKAVPAAPGQPALPGAGAAPAPEAAAKQAQAQAAQQAAQTAAQTAPATEGKAAVRSPGDQLRGQAAGPDASMVTGVPTPVTSQDPAPRAGQLGLNVDGSDPVLTSQIVSSSGWGARLQQSLHLNLGIPGLTPANLISSVGALIMLIVVLRVFFNGVSQNDVVGLVFAAVIGIMLMVLPFAIRGSRPKS